MAFGLDAVLGGLSTVQSVVGAFGAAARAKAAQEYRQKLLMERASQLNQERNDLITNNLTALRRAAGILGDELHGYASDVGAASAAAGLYNNTAVGGLISKQASENAAILADMTGQNFRAEQEQLHRGQGELFDRQLGVANENAAQAQADKGAAYQSLTNGIGSLAKYASDQSLARKRQQEKDQYQSILQTLVQPETGQSPTVQQMSPRNNGLYINGNQGSAPLAAYGNALPPGAMLPRRRLIP